VTNPWQIGGKNSSELVVNPWQIRGKLVANQWQFVTNSVVNFATVFVTNKQKITIIQHKIKGITIYKNYINIFLYKS
jgi:hypothetical protein